MAHGNFAPVQSRRFARPALEVSLCPSMDLIALSLGGAGATSVEGSLGGLVVASSVSIHRTLSWQKILTVSSPDLVSRDAFIKDNRDEDGNDAAEDENRVGGTSDGPAASSPKPPPGGTALCWSPDGRSVAVGLTDGGVVLFDSSPSEHGGSVGYGGSGGEGSALRSFARSVPPAPTMITGEEVAENGSVELPVGRTSPSVAYRRGKNNRGTSPFTMASPAVTRSKARRHQKMQRPSGVFSQTAARWHRAVLEP